MVEFTSSQQQFENKLNIADGSLGFAENTLGRIGASQIGPWLDLKTGEGTGRAAPPFPGEGARRWRGPRGRGGCRRRELPLGVLGGAWGGRRRLVGVTVAAAAVWLSGGGVPVAV